MWKKETLLKFRKNAYNMIENMKTDKNLRLVYADIDFYKFINWCDGELENYDNNWQDANNINVPF